MKCTDFELRLQCLFDERGKLDGDAELEAHALTCPECQSLVETYDLLFDGLKAHAAERRAFAEDCVELAARGLDSSEPDAMEPAAPVRSYRIIPWAAAAAVLLAVGLSVRTWQQPVADRGDEKLPAQYAVAVVPIAQPNAIAQPDRVVQPTAVAPSTPAQPSPDELAESTKPETLAPVPSQLVATDVPAADASLELADTDPIGLSFLEAPADEYAGLYRATGRSLAVMLRSIRPSHSDAALVEPVRDEESGGSWRRLHHSIEPLTGSMTEALEGLLRGKPATVPAATADRAS